MCLLLCSVLFGINTSQELLEENEEDTTPDSSMGTWCKLGKLANAQLSLSRLVVLGSLWNFRFRDLSPRNLDSPPVDY